MQILLVEDDELIAKGLTYSFKQNGYNLVHKTNIKDTSNFLQNEKIEFIILDISLPEKVKYTYNISNCKRWWRNNSKRFRTRSRGLYYKAFFYERINCKNEKDYFENKEKSNYRNTRY